MVCETRLGTTRGKITRDFRVRWQQPGDSPGDPGNITRGKKTMLCISLNFWDFVKDSTQSKHFSITPYTTEREKSPNSAGLFDETWLDCQDVTF